MKLLGKDYNLHERYTLVHDGTAKVTRGFILILLDSISYCLDSKFVYSDERQHRYSDYFNKMLDVVGIEVENRSFTYDDEEYAGTLSQRIFKYLYLDGVVTSEYQRMIFNDGLAAQTRCKLNELQIEFTQLINWQPGDFNESSGSCWWDDYSEGKLYFMALMQQGKAFAIKMFDEGGYRFGRCFGVLVEDEFILFNIYKDDYYSVYDALNILAKHFDVEYVPTGLYFNTGRDSVYVNGDKGYYFGRKTCKSSYEIDIEYEPPFNPKIERLRYRDHDMDDAVMCERCGRYYYDDDLQTLVPQNETICGYCISDLAPKTFYHAGRYYDRNYYHMSKSKHIPVRTKGKTWLPVHISET